MTEDEAKKKWCPMIRISDGIAASFNDTSGEITCVGSECMMWRWAESTNTDVGYCGLAGNPWRPHE